MQKALRTFSTTMTETDQPMILTIRKTIGPTVYAFEFTWDTEQLITKSGRFLFAIPDYICRTWLFDSVLKPLFYLTVADGEQHRYASPEEIMDKVFLDLDYVLCRMPKTTEGFMPPRLVKEEVTEDSTESSRDETSDKKRKVGEIDEDLR